MLSGEEKKVFKNVQKRDGRVVPFDVLKIENAIFKAAESAGKGDIEAARLMAQEAVFRLARKKKIYKKYIPTIEEIQDTVEQTLLDADENKIAKAYILYRQKRFQIRKEKAMILNKKEIDEVDKKFDINALRVLCSRYLKKDEIGRIVESPKQLFTRVAIHTALPSLFYDKQIFQKNKKAKVWPDEKFDASKNRHKYKIGEYFLNPHHLDGLKRVYERFNQLGRIKVSWSKLLEKIEKGDFDKYGEEISDYYQLMASRQFFPNTPALANFGNVFGMGSACFVLDIEDDISSIMDTLKAAAIIFKSGGGVGYNFSNLRSAGDFVRSTGGTASGPVSFMSLYDKITDVIKQGGIRRGANMGILNSNHPDIAGFIKCKQGNKAMKNFNLSVLVLPEFWHCLKEKKPYPLISPRSKKVEKYIDPQSFFDLISYQAWESAEPGVIFFDHINKFNPLLKSLGPIACTNPCGEVLLYPFESCNLASINLWSLAKRENGNREVKFDWAEFEKIIYLAVKFLDNVVEINKYPLPQIEEMTLKTRKIGLGMMGLADALFELNLAYDSKEGRSFMEKVAEFLNYHSKLASVRLAQKRGRFPLFEKSFYPEGRLPFSGHQLKKSVSLNWPDLIGKIKKSGLRNAFTTVMAPTGSISMIAGCSSGIEPNYSLVYEKNVAVGNFYYVNHVFEKIISRAGLFSDSLLKKVIENKGSVQQMKKIPRKLKSFLKTAMDISPENHIRALASLQKWVDSSISKTNNLPASATPADIKKIYLLAYELGCKDVTIFRDQSIKDQVLVAGGTEKSAYQNKTEKKQVLAKNNQVKKEVPEKQVAEKETSSQFISQKDTKAGGYNVYYQPGVKEIALSEIDLQNLETSKYFCAHCHSELVFQEGCKTCPVCGWSRC